jgi:hypothetical protein
MTASDIAAWIGALTGSIAFAWDVYKWRHSGPRLYIKAQPDMELMPPDPGRPQNQRYLALSVSNGGDKNTTLTKAGMTYYTSRLKGIIGKVVRRKTDRTWIIKILDLPITLEVGAEKCWPIPQPEPVEMARRNGVLYCEIYHALARKPVRKRIIFSPEPTPKELSRSQMRQEASR